MFLFLCHLFIAVVLVTTPLLPLADLLSLVANDKRKSKSKRKLDLNSESGAPSVKTPRNSTPIPQTELLAPPDSPPSPAYEVIVSSSCDYDDVPLRSLPSGFVIHGMLIVFN